MRSLIFRFACLAQTERDRAWIEPRSAVVAGVRQSQQTELASVDI